MSLYDFLKQHNPETLINIASIGKREDKKSARRVHGPTVATPEFIKEWATPADSKDSKEYEESDLVKFVKASNIDISGEFTIKDGWLSTQGDDGGFGSLGIASRGMVDLYTRLSFVKKRDEKTRNELKDNTFFKWYFDDWSLRVEHELKKSGLNDTEIKALNLTFKHDKYVLPLSKIAVKYPHSKNPITFTIMADDELRGFTVDELKEKLFAYYHMLLYMANHYDYRVNKCVDGNGNVPIDAQLIKTPFGYGPDGISGLVYNKLRDEWHVEKSNYC
jgi:hypothetical protein